MKKILITLMLLLSIHIFSTPLPVINKENEIETFTFLNNDDFEYFLEHHSHDYEIIEVISGERLENEDHVLMIFKRK